MKGLHVELLGIPGSGKSTLARSARSSLVNSGRDALWLPEMATRLQAADIQDRYVSALLAVTPRPLRRRLGEPLFARSAHRFDALRGFSSAHPDLMATIFRAFARRSEFEVRPDLVIGWILDLLSRYQAARGSLDRGTILILDEGFANRAVTLFGHRFSDADLSDLHDYVEAIPRPDLVIHVDLGVEAARKRLQEGGRRGTVRLATTEDTAQIRFLTEATACIRATVANLRQRGVLVATISGEGHPDEIAQAATELIVEVSNQRGAS
jgi:thymidylate kinase